MGNAKPSSYLALKEEVTRQNFEHELKFRLEFEELILNISNRFVTIDELRIDQGIQQALEEVGRFARVDRAYIFYYSDDFKTMDNRYEWCADGVEPCKDTLQNVAVNPESRFITEINELKVVHVPQVDLLEEDMYEEKAEWQREKIKSLICVPLISNNRAVGFLGFDSVREEKVWSRDFISLLRIVGSMLINLEERQRAKAREDALTSQMRHTQKLESLGVLAGGIAHDFNNLLMGMISHSELLLHILPKHSNQRNSANNIHQAAKRAAELTHQLLSYSGKAKFELAAVDLTKIIEHMTPLLKTAVTKKASLKFKLSAQPLPVEVDVTQIRQVLLNLITNASESLGESGGKITISTGMISASEKYLNTTYLKDDLEEGDYAYIEIKDTGRGIPNELLEKIFDPFFTTKFTGRGLGLAVVMGIIRSHKGAVKVESSLSEGTAFKVLFRCTEKAIEHEIDKPEEVTDLDQKFDGLVLVIDDEEITRLATEEMLEFSGFKALLAEDGIRGIELFRLHHADISAVLLDMTMPILGGMEVFVKLQEINPRVPVILSSGYSKEDYTEQIKDLNIAGFLQKPYGPSVLGNIVSKAIRISQQ